MNGFASKSRSFRQSIGLAGLAGAAMLISASAFAGGCPADKVATGGDGQKPGATSPKDVTDTVLASIDLSKEQVALPDHQLRLRRLVIKQGGEVPWHSHADRPAIIYIISGTVTEYSSTCTVPIVHKAGDVTAEMHSTMHWWKNTGKGTAVLLSADVLHDPADAHTM
jgi:quercetin dioxygenase-like cupin family protein